MLAPPLRSGERLGQLTLKACEGKPVCNVVYFYGIKGIPLDNALKQGFDATIASNPAIKIVAEGEGKYLGPDVGQTAMQDILVATPTFDVVVGSDQAMQGVELALDRRRQVGRCRHHRPRRLDTGPGGHRGWRAGSATSWARRRPRASWPWRPWCRRWQAPTRAASTRSTTLPDGGLVTKDNVTKFTAEWNG